MEYHRTRHGAVLGVVIALAATLASPAAAQWPMPACRVTVSLENQLRRVTGTVMEECPGIHSAPFGNWGVESDYDSRKDKDQFRGWKPRWGTKGQWNSCTLQYYDGEWVNDGRGRQKADPDDVRVAGKKSYYGDRLVSCRNYMGEVHTAHDVEMGLWELDRLSRDSEITVLKYGDIDVRITCVSDWVCTGTSAWHRQKSVDSTGVTAEARIVIRTNSGLRW